MTKQRAVLKNLAVLLVVFAAVYVNAAEVDGAKQPKEQGAIEVKKEEKELFDWGGDIRIRNEYKEDVQAPPKYSLKIDDYYRFRTRIWGKISFYEKYVIYARLCNEFRYWYKPDVSSKPKSSTYEFPDELIFDNLYLEITDALEGIDLKIGRQDISYGNKKVLYEGTAGDGTRAFYFDAVKATFKNLLADTKIDVFGIYNNAYDEWLAIGNVDRDVTGYTSANGAKDKDGVDESGAGIYLMNKTYSSMPIDLYWIFKTEAAYTITSGKVDRLDVHTAGFRVTPTFSKAVNAYCEGAVQSGERGKIDVSGAMVDAGVTFKTPEGTPWSPSLLVSVYYLSGDDPTTSDEEGWNPIFARHTQNNELYAAAYPGSRWSNLLMPGLCLSVMPVDWTKISIGASYLFAPEKDGPGGDDERGLLSNMIAEFDFGKKLYNKKDDFTGHVMLQILEPGDYYRNDETAYFFRWQLCKNF